jgi:hypothetical protein
VIASRHVASRSISALGTPDGTTRSASFGARTRVAQQQRQQQVALQVVGGDRDRAVEARRVEAAALGEGAQLVEQPARVCGQRLGARRGHDAAAGLDEQRIAGDRAQPVELVAHRRLRHVEPRGCAGDRAFLRHRQQHLQQPAVDVRMIDSIHGWHQYRPIYRRGAAPHTAGHRNPLTGDHRWPGGERFPAPRCSTVPRRAKATR